MQMNSKNMLIYLSKGETMRKLLSGRVGIIRNISGNLVFIPNKHSSLSAHFTKKTIN